MNLDEKNPWNILVAREALLLDQFRPTEDILLALTRENLITTDELDHLRSLHDDNDRTASLLFDILQYQDPALFPVFCGLLRNDEQHEVADTLLTDTRTDTLTDNRMETKKKPVQFMKKKRVQWDEKYINSLARQLGFTFVLVFFVLVLLVILDVQP